MGKPLPFGSGFLSIVCILKVKYSKLYNFL